jgi:hypothetical protein
MTICLQDEDGKTIKDIGDPRNILIRLCPSEIADHFNF